MLGICVSMSALSVSMLIGFQWEMYKDTSSLPTPFLLLEQPFYRLISCFS